MPDNDIRKRFGLRIKELRKQKKWTQKELAAKLDVRFPQLNKYECGLHAPPMEKLIQLAEIFDITVDYLLTGDRTDQDAVIKLIDAMIVKNKVEGAITPFQKKAS